MTADGAYVTPKWWPENTEPTPADALAWLRMCTEAEGTTALALLIGAGERASRCFVLDHEGEIERLQAWQRDMIALLRRHGLAPAAEGDEVPS